MKNINIKASFSIINEKIFFFSTETSFYSLEKRKIKYYPMTIKLIANPSYFMKTFSLSNTYDHKILKSNVKVPLHDRSKILPHDIDNPLKVAPKIPLIIPKIQYF